MTEYSDAELEIDNGIFALRIQRLKTCQLIPTNHATEKRAMEIADKLAVIDPWKTMNFSGAQLYKYLCNADAGGSKYFVECHGIYLGAVVIRYPWLRGPYLEFIGLVKSAQGTGIGSCILHWMEAEARSQNQRNLWVMTSAFNHKAVAFYEGFGFRRLVEIPDLAADGFDEIFLRKRLD